MHATIRRIRELMVEFGDLESVDQEINNGPDYGHRIAEIRESMKRIEALGIAQGLVDDLSPACVRIVIAGSLCRGAAKVKDIEILAIPGPGKVIETRDLFDEVIETEHLCKVEERLEILMESGEWSWRKDVFTKRWGPRYKRLRHDTGICCDLFLTDKRRWGYQLAIRTGPAMFSKALVTLALRRKYHCTDSLLHQHPKHDEKPCEKGENCPLIIPTLEEKDFLEALGLPWIEPAERTEEWLWRRVKEKVFK